MRTDEARPPAPAPGRFRVRTVGFRNWLADWGPRARWVLGLTALVALVAAGYVLTADPESPYEWLFDGHRLPGPDAERAVAALQASQITAVAEQGRLGVPRARKAEALALLAKTGLGPRSLAEIQKEFDSESPWSWPADREGHVLRRHAREAEQLICRAGMGIVSAEVVFSPARPEPRRRTPRRVRAAVSVQTEAGRRLGDQAIAVIREILGSVEPDLERDGVTLFDDADHAYLIPGHPDVGARSLARAHEEELRDRIIGQLNWIEDVRVSVTLGPTSDPEPALAAGPKPAIVPNQPLEPETPPEPSEIGRASVLVQVPIGYYYNRYWAHARHREPTPEDLKPLVLQTEESIKRAVTSVVPGASLVINRIEDPGPTRPPAPEESESRWPRPWWLSAAAGGAVAGLALAAVGGRWLAGRRPAPRAARPVRPVPYDSEDAAGPSERVRELVRHDPEAAAGVLRRWIEQGGRAG